MSSSTGQCTNCQTCSQKTGFICNLDGDFFTTGEYARTIEYFDIHGASFNQKIDSVKHQLDHNTIQILKVLLTETNEVTEIDLESQLRIVYLLDFIQSRLSNDNKATIPIIPTGDDL